MTPVSKTPLQIVSYAAGYVLVVLIVGAIALSILSAIIGLLVPVATAGAIHVGFVQGVAIATLGIVAGIVLKGTTK
jgi:hypothetical protein